MKGSLYRGIGVVLTVVVVGVVVRTFTILMLSVADDECFSGVSLSTAIIYEYETQQGPVVQNIVSLTSSLRGQLVMCVMTL